MSMTYCYCLLVASSTPRLHRASMSVADSGAADTATRMHVHVVVANSACIYTCAVGRLVPSWATLPGSLCYNCYSYLLGQADLYTYSFQLLFIGMHTHHICDRDGLLDCSLCLSRHRCVRVAGTCLFFRQIDLYIIKLYILNIYMDYNIR